MTQNLVAFFIIFVVALITVKGLAKWLAFMNRRSLTRQRERFERAARQRLELEPLPAAPAPSDDVLFVGRARDVAIRVTDAGQSPTAGGQDLWNITLEHPTFVPLPQAVSALRETSLLPEAFSLEPGRLRWSEAAASIDEAVQRLAKVLDLVAPVEVGAP